MDLKFKKRENVFEQVGYVQGSSDAQKRQDVRNERKQAELDYQKSGHISSGFGNTFRKWQT